MKVSIPVGGSTGIILSQNYFFFKVVRLIPYSTRIETVKPKYYNLFAGKNIKELYLQFQEQKRILTLVRNITSLTSCLTFGRLRDNNHHIFVQQSKCYL